MSHAHPTSISDDDAHRLRIALATLRAAFLERAHLLNQAYHRLALQWSLAPAAPPTAPLSR